MQFFMDLFESADPAIKAMFAFWWGIAALLFAAAIVMCARHDIKDESERRPIVVEFCDCDCPCPRDTSEVSE